MAMNISGQHNAAINVTPLIDVLLVLLIIFMVITPYQSVGLEARIPQPAPDQSQHAAAHNDVIVDVRDDRSIWINQERIDPAALTVRLREIFALRARGVLFVQGAGQLDFKDVAQVLDAAREAGVMQAALMTKRL